MVELPEGLKKPAPPVPRRAVHPRVMELPVPGNAAQPFDLALVLWDDPGGPEKTHGALRPLVEAALLVELSRPAATLPAAAVSPASLRFFAYADVPQLDEAVAAFGLRRDAAPSLGEAALRALRGEASASGREPPEAPVATFTAPAALPAKPQVAALETRLRGNLGEAVFGAPPGGLFAKLNEALEAEGEAPLPPVAASLDTLEAMLAGRPPGPLRWMPPLFFQALADAIGVIAVQEFGQKVQWAECQPDDEGVAPPPLVRSRGEGGSWEHVPLGLHLLRWCVMPLQAGERIPPLSEWMLDQFAER
ncbi:MAG: hypothetical protein AAF447_12040 [Myxococcota bacterium]